MEIKSIAAKETWQLRHEVMWPNEPFDFIKLPEDSRGTHFGLYLEAELVSVISLYETDSGVAQFRKFATKVDKQKKGYGTKILIHLIQYAQEQGFHTLWCNARLDKSDFYKKFGFLETKDTYIKRKIKFVILRKVL